MVELKTKIPTGVGLLLNWCPELSINCKNGWNTDI